MRKIQETIKEYDTVRRTTCCNCPAGCGMKVFVKDGMIVDIFGDGDHPINKGSLCPKGLLEYRHIRNDQRLLYPQIRDSLNKPFRRVSWDEAATYAAGRLNELMMKHGDNSLFIYGEDNMSFGYLAGGALFANHAGVSGMPYSFFPRAFGEEGGIKQMFGVPGSGLLMNTVRDWCNSRVIVLYSCDIAATDPVIFGHITDARNRGSILITIDSGNSITSSKANLALKIKPGSGTTVLKGIINILIQSGLYEKEFISECVSGFQTVVSETEPYTPERVYQESWVKEPELRKAAEVIGRSRPVQVVAADWRSRRFITDEDLIFCGTIVSLRGSVGIPGGGLNLLNVSPFYSPDYLVSCNNGAVPAGKKISGLSLEDILSGSEEVASVIWHRNPCAGLTGGREMKERLRDIRFIVHFSSYPDETFNYSHVSFPASSWLEYSGLAANNNTRSVQWHNRVVEPAGECMSPLDIWNRLAESCGFKEFLPMDKDSRLVDPILSADFFLGKNPLTRAASSERLNPEKNPPGGLLWPCTDEEDLEFEESRFIKGDIRGRNILLQRGQPYLLSDKSFPSEPGRINFIKSGRGGAIDDTPGAHTSDCEFPMILTTWAPVDLIDEYGYFVTDRCTRKMDQVVNIHPWIGKAVGVRSGDYVTVENRRGSISAPVRIAETADYRIICCPDGLDPYQPYSGYESFRSLFEPPSEGGAEKQYTFVTVYKKGQDRESATRRLTGLMRKKR